MLSWRRILLLLAVLTCSPGCGDDCVVAYRFDANSGLWVASGCGSITFRITPTPTPTPR